jgi:outer membrane protein assembly factor BamB
VLCLDAATGAVHWKRDLGVEFGMHEFAEQTSCPIVEQEMVIVVPGGKGGASVVALDLETGKEVWRAIDDSYTFSSPAVISAGGKRQFIV